MERRAVVPRRHPVNADHSPEEHANNRLISFHSWVRKAAGDKCAEDASNLSNGSMGHEHTMKRQVYTGQEHFHTSSAQGKFTMGKCTPRTLQPFDRKRQCRMDKCTMGNFAMVKSTIGKRDVHWPNCYRRTPRDLVITWKGSTAVWHVKVPEFAWRPYGLLAMISCTTNPCKVCENTFGYRQSPRLF